MRVEKRIGTRLLYRTSRHICVIETGTLYFNQIRQIDGLDEVEAIVGHVTVFPRGTMKLSAPVWFANTLIARMIADYHQRYPRVCLDMDFSGLIVNLVDEGFDLALRATASERLDPDLIARPLTKIIFHLVGSPAYLARTGRSTKLSNLNGHSLLLYSGMNANGSLTVDGPKGQETLKFHPVLRSEIETMLHMAALEDMGLVFLQALMIQPDIAEVRLGECATGHCGFKRNVLRRLSQPEISFRKVSHLHRLSFCATQPLPTD